MEASRVFLGGIPTDVDVAKIVGEIGTPEPGTLVPYEDLERIIGHEKGDGSRFSSVVGSWRRQLRREHNLVTEGIRGEGILVLDPDGRIGHVARVAARGARAFKRAYSVAASTPRDQLSPDRVRLLEHQTNLISAILHTGRQIETARAIQPVDADRIRGPKVPTLADAGDLDLDL